MRAMSPRSGLLRRLLVVGLILASLTGEAAASWAAGRCACRTHAGVASCCLGRAGGPMRHGASCSMHGGSGSCSLRPASGAPFGALNLLRAGMRARPVVSPLRHGGAPLPYRGRLSISDFDLPAAVAPPPETPPPRLF
jgi:hypothetical protein